MRILNRLRPVSVRKVSESFDVCNRVADKGGRKLTHRKQCRERGTGYLFNLRRDLLESGIYEGNTFDTSNTSTYSISTNN